MLSLLSKGYTQKQIAEELKMSQSNVSQKLNNIKRASRINDTNNAVYFIIFYIKMNYPYIFLYKYIKKYKDKICQRKYNRIK
ncbi:LuxR C-terminal-related transcriptional regulator [Brachyspira hyodysenteriae]|nr:LuxR C-terminal-related transcriptional regulator [Brachyspira hyodysenteriae]